MNRLTVPVGPADHVCGPTDAPVTLVEYGDFESAECGELYFVIKAVQRVMGSRLRFVFRNFPVADLHPRAARAAAFAEAAAAAGMFWDAHDLLYEHQDVLDDDSLFARGRVLGIERADIVSALEGCHADTIRRDIVGGAASGVSGTPCLFINGARYDGRLSLASLLVAVEIAAHVYA